MCARVRRQGTLTSACDDVSHVAGQGTWGVSIVAMVPREGELEPVVVAHQSFETEVKAAESRDDMAVLAGLAHVRLHFPERYQGKTPQQGEGEGSPSSCRSVPAPQCITGGAVRRRRVPGRAQPSPTRASSSSPAC